MLYTFKCDCTSFGPCAIFELALLFPSGRQTLNKLSNTNTQVAASPQFFHYPLEQYCYSDPFGGTAQLKVEREKKKNQNATLGWISRYTRLYNVIP